jgi:hypothetical protein
MKIGYSNISLLLFLIFNLQKASGQELKSLSLENNNNSIQSETVLLINVTPSDPNFCGIRIEWGDGEGQDFRYEKATSEPIKFAKKYVRPGDYIVSVKGKYLSRGLKSAQACRGSNLTLPVKVVDMEQIKQKNEIDRANEQLKIEATKRQDLELRLRAEQLKQQEAQIKQQEAQIKQQEAQIKQREEDALRQKIQAEERAKIQAELEASKLKEELAKRSAAEKKNEIRTTPPSTKPVQQSSPTPPKPTGF